MVYNFTKIVVGQSDDMLGQLKGTCQDLLEGLKPLEDVLRNVGQVVWRSEMVRRNPGTLDPEVLDMLNYDLNTRMLTVNVSYREIQRRVSAVQSLVNLHNKLACRIYLKSITDYLCDIRNALRDLASTYRDFFNYIGNKSEIIVDLVREFQRLGTKFVGWSGLTGLKVVMEDLIQSLN